MWNVWFYLLTAILHLILKILNYSSGWGRVRWEFLVGREHDTQRFSAHWHCRGLNINGQPLAFLWCWWWDISRTGFFRALTGKLGREVFIMQTPHLTSHWRPTRVSDLKGTNLVRVTLNSWKMTAMWPTHKTRKSGGRENRENFNAWNGCPSHTYTIKVAIIISLGFFFFPFSPLLLPGAQD